MLVEILSTTTIGLILILCQLIRKPRPLWTINKKTAGPAYRPLGVWELLMAKMTQTGCSNLSNVIFIRSKCPLSETIVFKALNALSQRHPLLRMKLSKDNSQFNCMEEIKDFKVDLEVCQTGDWQALMEEELLKTYDVEKGPLWCVRFLPDATYADTIDTDASKQSGYPHQAAFIFAFHHVVADGSSYLRLFAEFVDTLHHILNDQQPEVVKSLPLLPPMEAYIDNAKIYSPSYNLKMNLINLLGVLTSFCPWMMKSIAKSTSKTPLLLKTLGSEIDRNPHAQRKTCIIPFNLSREETTRLLGMCKKHKTTVQSAIQAAACLAYQKISIGTQATQAQTIECRLSCNLRRYLDSNELNDSLGMCMSIFTMDTKISPDLSFWELAENIHESLSTKVKAYEPILITSMLENIVGNSVVYNIFHGVTVSLPCGRNVDLAFNNYGNFNSVLSRDETSSVQLAEYFGCTGEHGDGPVFSHNVVTFNDKLSWTMVYYPHVTSNTQAKEYADLTIQTLLKGIKK